jgi:hypothetical protein
MQAFLSFFRIHHWAKIDNLKRSFPFKLNEAAGVGDFFCFVCQRPMEFVRFFLAKTGYRGLKAWTFKTPVKVGGLWPVIRIHIYWLTKANWALTTPGGGLGTPQYINSISCLSFLGKKYSNQRPNSFGLKSGDHIVYTVRKKKLNLSKYLLRC